ncbi:MAG: SpoIIE family protein phosphatase [Bacteroidales bacterium]|nr:SpoIIE family protein phosphatase [Bacteroidales bacterium]
MRLTKRPIIHLIIAFAFLLQNINSFAQEIKIFVLNDTGKVSSLNDYLQILKDSSKTLRLSDIVLNKDFTDFSLSKKLDKNSVYWAKLIIKNNRAKTQNILLQIGAKRHSDIADLFLLDDSGNILNKLKSGHFIPKSQKNVKNELGSKFLLNLEPDKNYTIYLRIQNISGFSPAFNVHIIPQDLFYENLLSRNLIQGILQGILWIMFLYNLLIFVYSRDKIYLWYSLYIVGIALNFLTERGLFIEYIIPENPQINPYVFILVTGLASVGYFQFLRLFLNTKEKMPAWDKAHFTVIIINVLITLVLLAELRTFFNLPFAINVSNYLNLFGLIYGLVFIVYLMKKGDVLARFFIIGTILLALGTITSLVYLIFKIPLNFDPKYFMNAGTIAEILTFSLGLGYRIRLIEKSKQKVQEKLIKQLEKNDKLKEKVNRELEQKVLERTAEIEQQKEEILAQSENLQVANRILIQQKREIEQKNDEIIAQTKNLEKVFQETTDSINYARRIQNTILPSTSILANYFEDYFILFKPKETVSGDFYWFKYLTRGNKQFFAFVAADATGHGVPGALVSMLGNSLLNETVVKNEVQKASDVLEAVRQDVKTAFHQSADHIVTRDGIDMAFCLLDLDTLELQYAGANRPLLIFNHSNCNGDDFIELKPDKNPIGLHHKEKPFTNHLIQLEKGNKLYLFSDGYPDQIGGSEGRKFYIRRFKELLTEIHQLPMQKQFEILEDRYDEWVNDINSAKTYRQVDDILVMGLTI